MLFWKKQDKIHIDCFTSIETTARDTPIESASNFIPDWWKRLPTNYDIVDEEGIVMKTATMKGCLGFIDLYNTGVIIPLWSDLNIKIGADGELAYRFAKFGALEQHQPKSYNNNYPKSTHMKLLCPWLIREKTGVKFLLTGCYWEFLEKMPKLTVVNGVLNFKLQIACNINMFAAQDDLSYQYDLTAGTPLAQLIPLSEKRVVPHIHLIGSAEWEDMFRGNTANRFYNWGMIRRKKERR